ncbi:hypothetical protein AGOR_G00081440 [Albula goreensis]|uniref:Uncharacterized protein n=1 Tax=Albula goreensis TaxID=1534307 RepID=A0A8T3DMK7_9TELE|nr:hypothetical protein AGOR_G00081440 [Albula goreensis]
MFKKSKGKVLVEYASEEDDMSWHHQHTYKDKDPDGEEEVLGTVSKVNTPLLFSGPGPPPLTCSPAWPADFTTLKTWLMCYRFPTYLPTRPPPQGSMPLS